MSRRLSPEEIRSKRVTAEEFRLEHRGTGAKQPQRRALSWRQQIPPDHPPRGRGRIIALEYLSRVSTRLRASVASQRDFAEVSPDDALRPAASLPPTLPCPAVIDHCVAIRASFNLDPDKTIGQLVTAGEITPVIVPAILDVLEKVLSRPRVAEGILDDKQRALTRAMYEGALDVSAFPVVTWEDVGDDLTPDDIFLLVAAAKAHLVLGQSVPVVTMDKRLLQTRGLREPVLTPEQFLADLRRKP